MVLKNTWAGGEQYYATDQNAVATAINNLGKRVVTPEDFGAVGDGVTNDSAAITEMFNSYTVANGGSVICIPSEKVYLTDAFDIKNNTYVFGGGTLKCRIDHGYVGAGGPLGGFAIFKNAVHNVTWIGPTLDINGKVDVNGFDIGDVPNSTDFVSDIYIVGTVKGSRIDTALENTSDLLYSGGGKGITVQFRARNVYANVRAEDCDIACSVESSATSTRHLENIVLDIQAKDSHRTALFIAGDTVESSLDAGGYTHSIYPGVKIRLRAQGGQDASITHPVTGVVGTNYDHAGVVTMNYASGVDLEVYAATVNRCTLIRGVAIASNIRVNNALMDDLEDGWDTRPIATHPVSAAFMAGNVFEANIHARTHHGVLIRPHRDATTPTTKSMIKTRLGVNAWCENGVGAITQSDGTTDGFGFSVAYRFCDMRSDPVREVAGISSYNALPTWSVLGNYFGKLTSSNFTPVPVSTVTAAGTTTLNVNDAQTQVFTGSTTQTVLLPEGAVTAGKTYTIVNNSTGSVTVQSAAGNTVATVLTNTLQLFVAQVDGPNTAAHWRAI